MIDPRTDKLVRRTTMVATITASYFLLTADYGSEPNALDPVRKVELLAGIGRLYHYLIHYAGSLISARNMDSVLSEAEARCRELLMHIKIKKAILLAENRVKGFVFGTSEKPQESHLGNLGGSRDSPKEHP